ncbi:imelysin family protein [Paracoccus sp. 1_MG-2023]|uniref:imelysin family protein n=1 Tax=unclassified Paracoccus (in: a-proteobacteria) TaxID=2688777 RepID=UPI001C0811B6|nr:MULTISPECIES: imelysin family protein [unclassified Paracoccus (in: a-proteobacteria)]MBU2958340.1 imelysin family protein [Paracoccus sp. C2R09]MDO6668467.1 imelysin family protein [Paracoccus sp. 1_MG-2023]
MRILLALTLLPLPAMAGTPEVVNDHILPATERFQVAAHALADTAAQDCSADALQAPYQDAFDAWMGLSHLGFGPLEQDGRALTVEFWPDPRGLVARSVRGLVADQDPVVDDAQGFAEVSIAGRGLMALEQVMTGEGGDYACRYARAITADLATIADDVQTDWQDHAALMLSAGEDGNDRYLSAREADQALYTALLSSIEFDADQRLGRPMGSFDKPRPKLAEAWRTDRPLRNIDLSLAALRDLAAKLSDDPIPLTEAAFDYAEAQVAELQDDPNLASVDDPTSRLKIEILQQRIRAVGTAIEGEIGAGLGLTAGFNSKDGD